MKDLSTCSIHYSRLDQEVDLNADDEADGDVDSGCGGTTDDFSVLVKEPSSYSSAGEARGGGGGGGEGKTVVEEKWYNTLLEVMFPFLVAGFGMVGAGVVLDIVQHWELFVQIPEIFTLIPALLGLKGNLEMTLASRFSTQVNTGQIRDRATITSAVLGNLALTQAQAIVVGFLASFGALALKFFSIALSSPTTILAGAGAGAETGAEAFDWENGLVIVVGSMATASFASAVLGAVMMTVILLSKRWNVNPDNVATPIAASLGDLVTLTILSLLCSVLFNIKHMLWLHMFSLLVFVSLVPLFVYFAARNSYVQETLRNGWTPIICAMIVSSLGGFIMSFAVQVYKDIAVFQPVVNGVGGNLVAIFASRLSTALHTDGSVKQGTRVKWAPLKWYNSAWDTFFAHKYNPEASTACVLASLALPGHLVFFYTIIGVKQLQENHPINPTCTQLSFIAFYLMLLFLQVILLLIICYWMVHFVWSLNKNPDNVCIPYLTAIGDLFGTAFLAFCFHVLYLAGQTSLRD